MFKTRLLSGIVLVAVALLTIISGGYVLFFTLLGIWMQFAGIPNSPFTLAFVLSTILETYFRRALSYSGIGTFFTRPISCVLIVFSLATVFWPIIRNRFFAKTFEQVEDDD